ncbi:putative zinc-binding metallopeptidase [Synoicihabitans lomoniglobus]|uniref:Zinc-binding metallopeptidase n=1 Tax=Synoicihabitans lomoniglobus TaxID=2909285 RepID=A0AAE9ZXZ8_9BACT|nr:putative zinc-binding metallopeptidase [Opitutaceae bacterium LMO-M01]WED65234.1 putative zinc-binding metallopeptidase [Opitutaceae bacterium LMO-M01]
MAGRWQKFSEERLLNTRMCDLTLKVEGTIIEERRARLLTELEAKGLRFRPHFWISEEWFTPDGVPGIAVPFYLTHPRLTSLERKFMLEAEGATESSCLRILRHEAGHAIDNAYRLHRRKRWRELFGSFTEPYPDAYRPRPASKRFVQHLNGWYAQAHPAEDFAETFAVWMTPGYPWRRRYQGWAALEKLEYVDALMAEIAGETPPVRTRRQIEPLSEAKHTLAEYFERKRSHYSVEWPGYYDRDLRAIFVEEGRSRARPPAASYLRSQRREFSRIVGEATGFPPYTIDQLLKTMIARCGSMKLRLRESPTRTRERMLLMLTAHTMQVAHAGYFPIAV